MSDKKRPQPPITDRLSGEERLSRLYQETTTEVPPPGLDATVLDTARQAVRQKPRRVYFLTARKWAVPLSLAAALVVTIGVVRLLRYEMESSSPMSSPVDAQPSTSSFRADARDETLLKRRGQKQLQVEEAPGTTHQTMKPLGEMADEDTRAPVRQSTPKLTAPIERQERKGSPRLQAQEPLRSVPLPAQSPPLSVPAPAGVAGQEKANVRADAAEPSQTPAQGQLLQRPEQQEEGRAASFQATERVLQGASASEGRGKMRVEGARRDKGSSDELSRDEWIAEIKKLRRVGKLAEAEASLKAFRQRYPDYPIEKALSLPHQSYNQPKDAR